MDKLTIAEEAYKNGYEKGYADCVKDFKKLLFDAFPRDKEFTTVSRFFIRTIGRVLLRTINGAKMDGGAEDVSHHRN